MEKVYLKSPRDFAIGFIAIQYGDKLGLKIDDVFEIKEASTYAMKETLLDMNKAIVGKSDSSMIEYSRDYATLLNKFGKLILSGLFYEKYSCMMKLENNYFFESHSEIRGELLGTITSYGEYAHRYVSKMLVEFSKDGSSNCISPNIYIAPMFDGIEGLNHAEILPILLTGLYSTLVGYVLGIAGEDEVRKVFKYGEDFEEGDAESVMQLISTLPSDKTESVFFMASMFNKVICHIEKAIGTKFNDRFSLIFKGLGGANSKLLDVRYDVDSEDRYDRILDLTNELNSPERMYYLLCEVLSPKSEIYVGDHPYDLRKFYKSQIINPAGVYGSYLENVVKSEDFNDNYRNISNYATVIDAHAYERLIKVSLKSHIKLAGPISNSERVREYCNLRFTEKLISDVFKYWSTSKSPLKIEGVDDMYVTVDAYGGSCKVVKPVGAVKYPEAYARVMEILTHFNARYCEAYEFIYRKKWARGIAGEVSPEEFQRFYKSLESVRIGDYKFESSEDAVRSFAQGKLPYLVTIAGLTNIQLNDYTRLNPVDLKKLSVFKGIDRAYYSGDPIRSIFDVMKSDSFSNIEVNEESNSSKIISDVIGNLTYSEHVYLTR